MRSILLGTVACLAMSGTVSGETMSMDGVTCAPDQVCRVDQTLLPLRVLPRPFSSLYVSPDDDSAVMKDNLPSFTPFFAFERQDLDFSDPTNPKGWYRVGATLGNPVGWLKAADVLEWRQSLMLAYRHPGDGAAKRPPALMFSNLESLREIAEAEDTAAAVAGRYEELFAGNVPEGVIATEPPGFVDIDNPEQFYVVPIVNYEEMLYLENDARYLQVAFATPGTRARTDEEGAVVEGTLKDDRLLVTFDTDRTKGTAPDVRTLSMDVVFAVDMTSSMAPSMEALRTGMIDAATSLETQYPGKVRFGLVGYRDDLAINPDLEFVARNFTPELEDAATIAEILETSARAAESGSDDYAEEMFAGVEEALNSAWRPDSEIRVIALIGDASSHPFGHPQNTINRAAPSLREAAKGSGISIAALHLREERAEEDWALAEAQFRALSTNADKSAAYRTVDANDAPAIRAALEAVSFEWNGLLNAAAAGDVAGVASAAVASTGEGGLENEELRDDLDDGLAGAMRQAVANQLVAFLGSGSTPPRDFTAWIFDYDLERTSRPALDVRLMTTRAQVADIADALDLILDAGQNGQMMGMDFFTALRALTTQATADQDITQQSATALGKSAFLPRWIDGLPYRSELTKMTPDEFEDLSTPDRIDLLARLKEKHARLLDRLENSDVWIQLDERMADPNQQITALPLEMLP